MLHVPPLTTERLLIRPFTPDDFDAAYQLFDVDLADAETAADPAAVRAARRRWLDWTVLGYRELEQLYQPPYNDRAITLRATGELIGAGGYAPCLAPFAQIPALNPRGRPGPSGLTSPEVGLYWALAPAHRRRGYATEAARALIDFAFQELRLARIVATTTYDNTASIAVMRRAGMRVERNPCPEPPYLQVVGVLENLTDVETLTRPDR